MMTLAGGGLSCPAWGWLRHHALHIAVHLLYIFRIFYGK